MPNTIVIFGASGDLTSRKLIPSLYQLFRKKRLPEQTRVVGFSRTKYTHDEWRKKLAESTQKYVNKDFDAAQWAQFSQFLFYQAGDLDKTDDVWALAHALDQIEEGKSTTRIYYLSTAPQFYETAVAQLGVTGLADESRGVRRIVIEKPFGTNLTSARALNDAMHQVFKERQVYRIDHYLGKETVQNILVFRFGNTIFEPLWNRNYIDSVQITVAEDLGVEKRGEYYDKAGVVRDMFQNHLLQLLTITAMEVPARFEADLVRNEKVKVLQAMRQVTAENVATDTIRAQYDGYLKEEGVSPESQTPTFAAMKLHVDNWRWQGVPFYLRSGKELSCRTTQIVIQFREPPHMVFGSTRQKTLDANRLVIQIQPSEGLQLHFQTKVPDAGMKLRLTDLEFRFDTEFPGKMPEAYERLLLDTLTGDPSLFARSDEVELAWGIIDPIVTAWEETGLPEMVTYEPKQWGPLEAQKWIWQDGREWLDTCPVSSD